MQAWECGGQELPATSLHRGEARRDGDWKGRNVLVGGGPPSIPWGLGGEESLKCFQKNEEMVPAPGVAGDPLEPKAQ
jgi:hypothetical protein